jgi:hypothetical protein
MAKGTKTGGGSRKGIPNKATAEKAQAIASSGLTPLDFMLDVMRDEKNPLHLRASAAKDAAPYVHPRLANIEHTGRNGGPIEMTVGSTDAGL